MIINVNQIEAGGSKTFAVSGAERDYHGYTPGRHGTGVIGLGDQHSLTWTMKYKAPPLLDRIRVGAAFGRRFRQSEYVIFQNDVEYGLISQFRYEVIKTRYDVDMMGNACQVYPLLQGGAEFMLVFQGDKQIAHIRRETATVDLKDQYTIYLKEGCHSFAVQLILFVLYYDHWEHGDRGKFRRGSRQKSYGWSYGEAQERYDAAWLPANFPGTPPEPVEIDLERSRKIGRRLTIAQVILEIVCRLIMGAMAVVMLLAAWQSPAEAAVLALVLLVVNAIKRRAHYRR